MQVTKLLDSKVGMVLAVAAVGGVVLYYGEKKARAAAAAVGDAVNPINDDNVFASGVDAVGAKVTGNSNFKLGGWIYEQIHGSSLDQINNAQTGG
ncbi:hypothetical protein [Thalassotalea hakodatensis]|uniref:hypothetical protein n=1 Tax=Thalassotalea hakodatensis TaxID=3030492 RepID=UPI002572A648|nr:hypothetical protein [Thalassotalea hakodatensis]